MNERVKEILEGIASAPLSSFSLDVFTGSGKPSAKWSSSNRLIMILSGTHDARGYRQWNEVGRHVKAGAWAIYILAPIEVTIKEKSTDESGEEIEQEIRMIKGFRAIPVFRVEDTDGEPLPEEDFANYRIPVEFERIVGELGLQITAGEFEGDAYGWYAPGFNAMKIMSPDVEVFLHELSHAVDDKLNGNEGSPSEKEFVAELSAGILGGLLGYTVSKSNVREYLNGYGFRDLMSEVKLIERTMKVVEWIVQRTSKTEEILTTA